MAGEKDVDLERCVTASVKQCTGSQASSTSEATRHCPIAVQVSNGKTILINVALKEEVNGHLVLNSAMEQLSQALAESRYQRLVGKLLMNIIVGTAKVRQVIHFEPHTPPSSSHRSSPPPPRLYLKDFIPDPLLTEALHDPNILFHAGETTPPYLTTDTHDQSIILIKRTPSKTKTAWLLTSLLLLSPNLGLLIGLCAHNAEVGIAISAGVFALATFVQGLVAWVQG